jgi:hypothetical protein
MEHAGASVDDPQGGWSVVTSSIEQDLHKALRHCREGRPVVKITDQSRERIGKMLEEHEDADLTINREKVGIDAYLAALQASATHVIESGEVDQVLEVCEDIRIGYIQLFTAIGPTYCEECDSNDGLYIEFADMHNYGRYCREHLWALLQKRVRESMAEDPVILVGAFQYQDSGDYLHCINGEKYDMYFDTPEEKAEFLKAHPPATIEELIEFRRKESHEMGRFLKRKRPTDN